MHHCVERYADRVLTGVSYAYRVMAPERATLVLNRYGEGCGVAELRGHANARPAAATKNAVKRWLAASGKTARGIPGAE